MPDSVQYVAVPGMPCTSLCAADSPQRPDMSALQDPMWENGICLMCIPWCSSGASALTGFWQSYATFNRLSTKCGRSCALRANKLPGPKLTCLEPRRSRNRDKSNRDGALLANQRIGLHGCCSKGMRIVLSPSPDFISNSE